MNSRRVFDLENPVKIYKSKIPVVETLSTSVSEEMEMEIGGKQEETDLDKVVEDTVSSVFNA
jgi:hypothetical protein